MKIKLDTKEGTMYIELGKGVIRKTTECASEVFLDFDGNENLIGVELINLRGKI